MDSDRDINREVRGLNNANKPEDDPIKDAINTYKEYLEAICKDENGEIDNLAVGIRLKKFKDELKAKSK